VSHFIIRLRFVLAPSLADLIIFLTLTRLVVVIVLSFSVLPYSPPPSRRLSFIKTFKKFVRKNDKYQRKGRKRACYECGQTGHFIADCPNKKEQEAKKEHKKDKFKKGGKSKGYFKKKYGQAHISEEWNSDEESSSSEEEVANIAIQSTSTSRLFTNLSDDSYTPTCLMAKGDEVHLFNVDFADDDVDDQLAMKNKMIKEFGLNGYNVITKLMEKLDKRKATLMLKKTYSSLKRRET
jgi:hypothetical protein